VKWCKLISLSDPRFSSQFVTITAEANPDMIWSGSDLQGDGADHARKTVSLEKTTFDAQFIFPKRE